MPTVPFWLRAEDASSRKGRVRRQEPIIVQLGDAGIAANPR